MSDGREVRVRDRRLPGEPSDGRSPQLQSWVNAGQDVQNFLGSIGNWFQGLGENYQRNAPSQWPPAGSDAPRTGPPNNVENIIRGTGTRAFQDPLGARGLFGMDDISSRRTPPTPSMPPDILGLIDQSGTTGQPQADPAGLTFEQWLAANTGMFDETPYRNYMDFLTQQDEETMARINAMYAQLAENAGANMQRVTDVYDTARIQSGDVFGQSAQNIEDAYASASQQAADQMARLGVEAAAPAVMNPMALSQAEAVSGIERAGAGALDALTRYGASAQDFGGQMAQVGQQQGTEVSSQIMRDIARRQAEAALQMEQARASFNPYANALQEMEMRSVWNQMQSPQMDWRQEQAMADFESKLEGRDLSTWDSYYKRNVDFENGDQEKALRRTVWEASMGMLGPRIQQQVMNDPELSQYLQ